MEELSILQINSLIHGADGKRMKKFSYHAIADISSCLQEYIENVDVLRFILSLESQDLQMELFFIWLNVIKDHLRETLIRIPATSFTILKN